MGFARRFFVSSAFSKNINRKFRPSLGAAMRGADFLKLGPWDGWGAVFGVEHVFLK